MLSRRNRFALTLVFSSLALCSAATARITLSSGELSIDCYRKYDWTIDRMTFDGRDVCTGSDIGSAQGSVITIDGLLVGSGHMHTVGVSQTLLVDGLAVPAANGLAYDGQLIQFSRTSILAEAWRLTSELTITPNRIVETATFEGLDAEKMTSTFYGFLGSRTDRFNTFAFYDRDAEILRTGQATTGGSQTYHADGEVALAQYDPETGDGVLIRVDQGRDDGLILYFIDRYVDNKMYARFTAPEGPADPDRTYTISSTTTFFQASESDWLSAARSLVPAVPGDADGDGQVDLTDLGIVASNWGRTDCEGPAVGDFTFCNGVNLSDLGVLATNWGTGGQAIPEPATLAMLAMGGLTVIRRRRIGR